MRTALEFTAFYFGIRLSRAFFNWLSNRPLLLPLKVDLPQTGEPQAEFVMDCMKWRGRLLTGRFAHYCYDWDLLPIDETCDEWPCPCAPGLLRAGEVKI